MAGPVAMQFLGTFQSNPSGFAQQFLAAAQGNGVELTDPEAFAGLAEVLDYLVTADGYGLRGGDREAVLQVVADRLLAADQGDVARVIGRMAKAQGKVLFSPRETALSMAVAALSGADHGNDLELGAGGAAVAGVTRRPAKGGGLRTQGAPEGGAPATGVTEPTNPAVRAFLNSLLGGRGGWRYQVAILVGAYQRADQAERAAIRQGVEGLSGHESDVVQYAAAGALRDFDLVDTGHYPRPTGTGEEAAGVVSVDEIVAGFVQGIIVGADLTTTTARTMLIEAYRQASPEDKLAFKGAMDGLRQGHEVEDVKIAAAEARMSFDIIDGDVGAVIAFLIKAGDSRSAASAVKRIAYVYRAADQADRDEIKRVLEELRDNGLSGADKYVNLVFKAAAADALAIFNTIDIGK